MTAVVIFSDKSRVSFAPSGRIQALGAQLAKASVVFRLLDHFSLSPADQFKALLQASVTPQTRLVIIRLERDSLAPAFKMETLARLRAVSHAVPAACQVWLAARQAGLSELSVLLPEEAKTGFQLCSDDELSARIHAEFSPATPYAPNLEAPIEMTPSRPGPAGIAVLRRESCHLACSACAQFFECKLHLQGGLATLRSHESLVRQLFVAGQSAGRTHYQLIDLLLDESEAHVRWLAGQTRQDPGLRFIVRARLDALLLNEGVLEALRDLGLAGIDIQVDALNADARNLLGRSKAEVVSELRRIRAVLGADVAIQVRLWAGIPTVPVEALIEDVQTLLARPDLVDFLEVAPLQVEPGSVWARQGYKPMAPERLEVVMAEVSRLKGQANPLWMEWPRVSALLDALSVGVSMADALLFLRAGRKMTAAQLHSLGEHLYALRSAQAHRQGEASIMPVDAPESRFISGLRRLFQPSSS